MGDTAGGSLFRCCSICIFRMALGVRFDGPFGPFFLGTVRYVHCSSATAQWLHGQVPSHLILRAWQQSHACLTFGVRCTRWKVVVDMVVAVVIIVGSGELPSKPNSR